MKFKQTLKILVDIAMTVVLMFLMSYMLAGPQVHEWLGCVMFVLFILHHILNFNWHKNIFKGKYSFYRALMLIVDVLIFFGMMVSMVTGIILSMYVFRFVNISSGLAASRSLHMLAAYWNFVLLSVHLGLHWSMMAARMAKPWKNMINNKTLLSVLTWLVRAVMTALAVYGLILFKQENIIGYLTGSVMFAFYDFGETAMQFVIKYMIIMESLVFIVYYVRKAVTYVTGHFKHA